MCRDDNARKAPYSAVLVLQYCQDASSEVACFQTEKKKTKTKKDHVRWSSLRELVHGEIDEDVATAF